MTHPTNNTSRLVFTVTPPPVKEAVQSIVDVKVVKRPVSGISAVTLLTNSCVLKRTHSLELASELLYRQFAAWADSGEFKFPKISGFDLDQPICVQGNELTYLRAQTAEKVHTRCASLFWKFKNEPTYRTIVQAEMIKGDVFPQVIFKEYDTIEDKRALFLDFGRLAFMDLILGNNDRLIRTVYDERTEALNISDIDANLDNLMATANPFFLYAIDNALNPELCEPENQKLYLEFLRTVLPELETLSQKIQYAIFHNLDMDYRPYTINKHPFMEALNSPWGKQAIRDGMNEMQRAFFEKILPQWRSEKSVPFKTLLSQVDLQLVEIVNGFLSVLENSVSPARCSSVGPLWDGPTPLCPTPTPCQEEPRPFSVVNQ